MKEKQHFILGNWIEVERVKDNKNKNYLEQNAYPTYEIISQKKKNWKSKNRRNLLRSFNTFNSYEEPPYLNPSKIQQNNLFIYHNYDSDKSNNNSMIDDNEIMSKSILNNNDLDNNLNEKNQNFLKENLKGNYNNIIKKCKEDEIDTNSTNYSSGNSNNNNNSEKKNMKKMKMKIQIHF